MTQSITVDSADQTTPFQTSSPVKTGYWQWNIGTNQIYFCPRWKAMLGYSVEQLQNHLDEWFSRVHPEDLESLRRELKARAHNEGEPIKNQYRIRHKDGSWRWMITRCSQPMQDEGGEVWITGTQVDITDQKVVEEHLENRTIFDLLTGLPNRLFFTDLIKNALRRFHEDGQSFAVLFLDLDRFKVINNSLGHAAGDELLNTLARRLETCVRSGDVIARYGGDEFMILLQDIDEGHVRNVVERIQNSLKQPFVLDGEEVFTEATVGIVLGTSDYRNAEDLIRDAGTALHKAKSSRMLRHEVFMKSMHESAVALLRLESDLRKALEKDQLQVVYQPIVSLRDGNITGCEALIRWDHPTRGMVEPSDFISISEEIGLIIPLGEWVLKNACTHLRQWKSFSFVPENFCMNVNLSGIQLMQNDLVDKLAKILHQTGVDPRDITLEITETVIMHHPEDVIRRLKQFKKLGMKINVDDFGTGYSSLSYLNKFPIDALKIDRSFVSRMNEDRDKMQIARTIISLAHALQISVTAEGVETQADVDILKALDCEKGQGYYFCKPLAKDDFEDLLYRSPEFRV